MITPGGNASFTKRPITVCGNRKSSATSPSDICGKSPENKQIHKQNVFFLAVTQIVAPNNTEIHHQ